MSKTISLSVEKQNTTPAVRKVTMTAMLAAISYIMAFAEFPVPLSPSFARMDLSDFPALIGAFTMMVYKRLTPVLKGNR